MVYTHFGPLWPSCSVGASFLSLHISSFLNLTQTLKGRIFNHLKELKHLNTNVVFVVVGVYISAVTTPLSYTESKNTPALLLMYMIVIFTEAQASQTVCNSHII